MSASRLLPLDSTELHLGNAGGKAYQLSRVARAGFRVPRSEVLPVEVMRELRTESGEAVSLTSLPAQLETELRACCQRLAHRELGLAVRSSGLNEDSATSSLAGHYSSVLGVRSPKALIEAVREVWESYLRVPPRLRSLGAVLIQEMIPASASGVFFTRSPLLEGEEECLVEACSGLGDALVAGRVTPDVFRLRRSDGSLLQQTLAQAPQRSLVCEHTTGTRQEPLPPEQRGQPSLSPRQLALLHSRCRALQQAFAEDLDIEFSFVADELVILQARPITVRALDPDAVVWTAANSQEVLPQPVTPLTWSLFYPLIEQGRADLFAALNLKEPRVRRYLDLFYGRPYFNRLYFKEFIAQTPGVPLEVFDALIFGRGEQVDFRRPPLTGLTARILARAGWERMFAQQRLESFIRAFDRRQRAVEADYHSALDNRSLLAVAERTRSLMAECFGKHVLGTAFAGAHMVFLRAFLDSVGVEDAESTTNRLVHASATVLPAASSGQLFALARRAAGQPGIAQAIETEVARGADFDHFAEQVRALPRGPAFIDGLDAFRREFGHRGVGEAELMQPRWSEDAPFLFATLKMYLQAPTEDPERRRLALLERQQKLETSILARPALKNPLRRLAFHYFLREANRFAAYRENLKHHALRSLALLRRIVLELARRLVADDRLAQRDDVFFLNLSELRRAALTPQGGSDLRALVSDRRLEHQANLALKPPRFIYREAGNLAAVSRPSRQRMSGFLSGSPLSPGTCRGRARVVLSPGDIKAMQPGEVLVAPVADPGWTPLYYLAAGIAVDVGGVLSHAAVIAREYGVPAVADLEVATQRIKTGDLIEVDGDVGQVRILRRGD